MQKDKPLVSVVLSCYNYAEYVGKAIESVLNQTYENIEIIAVDNGSTDDSYEVMNRYGDRIQLMRLEENSISKVGALSQRYARGDYFAFMTADDMWMPDKIEKQMEVLMNNPEVGACFTWIHTIDEEDNIVPNTSHNVFSHENRSRYEWMEWLIWRDSCFAYPTCVISRESLKHSWDSNYIQIGDKYLWMRVLLEYDVHVVTEPLALIRWHPKSKVANMSAISVETMTRKLNEEVIVMEDIIERMDDSFFIKTFQKYMRNPAATEHQQILCEKFFLLQQLAEEKKYLEPVPIAFFHKHNVQMIGCMSVWERTLLQYYNYSLADFKKYYSTRGMGKWNLQLSGLSTLQKNTSVQALYVAALQDVNRMDVDAVTRQALYRNKVYQGLEASTRELITVVHDYIGNLLNFIENSTDEVLEAGIGEMIANVNQACVSFENLWKEFLWLDDMLGAEEWKQNISILQSTELDADTFCEFGIPFIVKIYEILNIYMGI